MLKIVNDFRNVTKEELKEGIKNFTDGYKLVSTLTENALSIGVIIKTHKYMNQYNHIIVKTYEYTYSDLVSANFYV